MIQYLTKVESMNEHGRNSVLTHQKIRKDDMYMRDKRHENSPALVKFYML
jgi:hypothetical protein